MKSSDDDVEGEYGVSRPACNSLYNIFHPHGKLMIFITIGNAASFLEMIIPHAVWESRSCGLPDGTVD